MRIFYALNDCNAAILGRLPGTTVYRNIQQYPEAYTYHGIVIVRIDAPIYFANISYIKDRYRQHIPVQKAPSFILLISFVILLLLVKICFSSEANLS